MYLELLNIAHITHIPYIVRKESQCECECEKLSDSEQKKAKEAMNINTKKKRKTLQHLDPPHCVFSSECQGVEPECTADLFGYQCIVFD